MHFVVHICSCEEHHVFIWMRTYNIYGKPCLKTTIIVKVYYLSTFKKNNDNKNPKTETKKFHFNDTFLFFLSTFYFIIYIFIFG